MFSHLKLSHNKQTIINLLTSKPKCTAEELISQCNGKNFERPTKESLHVQISQLRKLIAPAKIKQAHKGEHEYELDKDSLVALAEWKKQKADFINHTAEINQQSAA